MSGAYIQPFFSVIIPLYNKEEYVKRTLTSLLLQSYADFEIIIVNDGSTDDSLKIVEAFDDARIKAITQKNQGVSVARNKGIEISKGKFVAFLDADDYWYPNHLDTLKNSIHMYPNEVIFCANYKIEIAENIFKDTQFYNIASNIDALHLITNYFESSLLNDIAWTSAVCVKKRVFTNDFLFDTLLLSGQDTDLWIRLGLHYNFVLNTKVTSVYKNNIKESLSNSNSIAKRYLLTQKYLEEEKENKFLNKYIDNNRFAIALQLKMSNNKEKFRKVVDEISDKNLNKKQKATLKMPVFLLIILKKIKNYLEINNYDFTLYN